MQDATDGLNIKNRPMFGAGMIKWSPAAYMLKIPVATGSMAIYGPWSDVGASRELWICQLSFEERDKAARRQIHYEATGGHGLVV